MSHFFDATDSSCFVLQINVELLTLILCNGDVVDIRFCEKLPSEISYRIISAKKFFS